MSLKKKNKKISRAYFHLNKKRKYILTLLLLIIGSACTGVSEDILPFTEVRSTPYIPPTVRIGSTPIALPLTPQASSLATQSQSRETPSTPTPACKPDLTFIRDLTLPDGTVVLPEQQLDKRWQVENNGSCNWDMRYRLKLVAGPNLGAVVDQALYPARSNSQALIRITFTAPEEIGVHRSAWQAHDPQGEPFGDPIFIEIAVQEPPSSQDED
jgi:hypothetical protein